MTLSAEILRFGRRPLTVVEIDLDWCANTYGVAPCTASIPTTGAAKCFNTFATCQDQPHWSRSVRTLRFTDMDTVGAVADAIPSIAAITRAPTRITPGKGLGQRASITIQFDDHTWGDYRTDPYRDTRTYNPESRGTFWGRLLARSPYYQGRALRILTGYLTEAGVYDVSNFRTQTYVIEKIAGPDQNGRVTVTAKDPLKLAANDRSQAPLPTKGSLSAAVLAAATSATLIPAGIGNSDYAAAGWVTIDKEVCAFTRSGDVLTLTRAQYGTTVVDHALGQAVQQCLVYTSQKLVDVIYNLLTVFAGVQTTLIDKAAWDVEGDTWLADAVVNTIIIKPDGVTKLIDELCSLALVYIWWDERLQLVQLKAVRPAAADPITSLNEIHHLVQGSVSVTDQPDERISEAWIYYDRATLDAKDQPEDYRRLNVQADLSAASADQYGERRVRILIDRWFGTNDSVLARTAARLVSRYRDNPRQLTFRVDAKDGILWTGALIALSSITDQDATGANRVRVWQIIQAKEVTAGTAFEYLCVDAFYNDYVPGGSGNRYAYVTPDSSPDYPSATTAQRDPGGFICLDTALMPSGDLPYRIIP